VDGVGNGKGRERDMKTWTELLEKVIPSPCNDRPFVCNGLPDASKVMVIGENPATPTNKDWWSYWDDKKGFDYDAFLIDYKKNKNEQRKNAGKKELPEVFDGVRNRFYHIRAKGVECIETNVYRNEKPDGAGKNRKINTALLKTLVVNNKNLKLIIAHGDKAQEGLGFTLASKENQEIVGKYRKNAEKVLGEFPARVKLYATRHFTSEKHDVIEEILHNYKII
jgi:uracil-DNA glycosylase